MPTLFKNIKLSIATFISRIISGSIVYIVLARVMDLNDFGILSFGTTFAALLTVIAEFGFSLMAQRDIPKSRFPFNEYVFNAFVQKFGISFLSILGGLIYLLSLYSGINVTIGIIFLVNAIVTSNNMYLFSIFRAINMFKIESWLAWFYTLFLCGILILYLIFKLDLIFLSCGLLFGRFAQLIILTYFFIRKFGKLKFSINKTIQQYFFKNSFSFGAHYVIGVIYFTVDNQLIFYYAGANELAIYQAFFKIVLILLSLGELLNNVFIPYLSARINKDYSSFISIASIANKSTVILGLFLFLFVNLFSADLLHFLYSDKFNAALPIVVPLSLVLLIRISTSIYAVLLTVSDHQNIRVLIVIISLIVNIGLNFWLIPLYGFVGAAYVSMITHIIILILYVYFANKYFKSLLLNSDSSILITFTLILVFLIHLFYIYLNFIHLVIILFGWIISLILIFNKKFFTDLKKLLKEKYI